MFAKSRWHFDERDLNLQIAKARTAIQTQEDAWAAAEAAALEQARQAYNLEVAGTRYEEIAVSESTLQGLHDDLTSPTNGVIRSRLLEVGDIASEKIFEGNPAQIFIKLAFT